MVMRIAVRDAFAARCVICSVRGRSSSERRQISERGVINLSTITTAMVVRVAVRNAFGNQRVPGIAACVVVILRMIIVSKAG